MLGLNDSALPNARRLTGDNGGVVVLLRAQSARALLVGKVGKLNSWRTARDGHKSISGILRVEWPRPEIGGRVYPKQVAAPNRFCWPRSAETERWPRPKYADFALLVFQQSPAPSHHGSSPMRFRLQWQKAEVYGKTLSSCSTQHSSSSPFRHHETMVPEAVPICIEFNPQQ